MKNPMNMIFGLCLSLTVGGSSVYAAPSTNFWDDAEDQQHFDAADAIVGSWSGGEVRDTFIDGIPDTPGGGLYAILVSRGAAWPVVGTATEQAVLTGTVHFEWDMYVDDRQTTNNTALAADSFLLNQDHPFGHPLNGTFPYLRVRRLDGVNAFLDEVSQGTNLAPVMINSWHHYELDYTVGAPNTLVLTVDGGTNIPIAEPFGFEGLTGDLISEVKGLMFRPPGSPDQIGEAYVDNVLLVIDNPPLKEEAATAMDVANTRALVFGTLLGIRYGLESSTDLIAGPWTQVGGWTVVGTGGDVNIFDPSPPDADTERHYRVNIP